MTLSLLSGDPEVEQAILIPFPHGRGLGADHFAEMICIEFVVYFGALNLLHPPSPRPWGKGIKLLAPPPGPHSGGKGSNCLLHHPLGGDPPRTGTRWWSRPVSW